MEEALNAFILHAKGVSNGSPTKLLEQSAALTNRPAGCRWKFYAVWPRKLLQDFHIVANLVSQEFCCPYRTSSDCACAVNEHWFLSLLYRNAGDEVGPSGNVTSISLTRAE